MMLTYRKVPGKERVKTDTWFQMASDTDRRRALILRPNARWSDVRMNFFPRRVVSEWNKISSEIKMATSGESVKERYAKFRDKVVSSRKECGRMETMTSRTETLERPHRGYGDSTNK
jgi:hypothetical protein